MRGHGPSFYLPQKNKKMKEDHIQYLVLRIQALEKYNNELQEQIKQLQSKINDGELVQ